MSLNRIFFRIGFSSTKTHFPTTMIWLILSLGVVALLAVTFYRYQTATHGTFQTMKVDHPPPSWFSGNFGQTMKVGIAQSQMDLYTRYKYKKVYGFYNVRKPILTITDLDMIKDIMVKHFNSFTDRQQLVKLDPPFRDNLVFLRGNHWKHVRNVVSPTFSSGRIKRMTPHILRNCRRLVDVLGVKEQRNEAVELKEFFSRFTLDVIASTGFGLDVNTLENPENQFAVQAINSRRGIPIFVVLSLFAPWLLKLLIRFGFAPLSKESISYFSRTIDLAMEDRKREGQAGKVNDFMDLLINAEKESDVFDGSLTRDEIHAQVMLFIMAGFDTVSTVLSFTLFLLTNHPENLHKVQTELKEKLDQDEPNYDNIQNLTYLDMVINESIRMFPPALNTDRVCTEDITLHGIHIPKNMVVSFPVYALHHDPDIWPEPERFLPERFTAENKESRHQFAFLPFGYGPRNCIGMRLALLELKLCLAHVLKSFSPVLCQKTVYPVRLHKLQMRAEHGLWVKFHTSK